MRLEHRGEYPPDWADVAQAMKELAGWRCVRCRHPFWSSASVACGHPRECDRLCDPRRCRAARIQERGGQLTYTVHHLDGDKANCRWWNLLATCNSCHLSIQSRVIVERPWLFPHSEWFIPYVCGFYAFYYGGEEICRAQAAEDPARYLGVGQPWLAEAAGEEVAR